MANRVTRHIPNTVTCCNLFSGCIAVVMAFQADYEAAVAFILLGAVFDFFDGMLARLLDAHSPIGKDLDSLADCVSFGFAPSLMVFSLLREAYVPELLASVSGYIPYLAFLIAVFSALRLAKFNIDIRQTSSFIGLPTPANALFWGALVVGTHGFLVSESCGTFGILVLVVVTSCLLVAEIPMFSLKFKNLTWADNKVRFIFLLVCIPMVILLGVECFAAIIIWYALLSLITQRKS